MLSEQSFDGFVHGAKTARARRVPLRTRAHSLLYEGRDALRDRSPARVSNLFTHIRLIKAEAIAERDRILLLFQTDAHAQVIGGESCVLALREVNNAPFRVCAKAIAARANAIEVFRLEHQQHRFAGH
jgi:hypothetical protein